MDENEIENALSAFGLSIDDEAVTDPVKMQSILFEIGLSAEVLEKLCRSDKNEKIQMILKDLQKNEIPLGPLKKRILTGIVKNPPVADTILRGAYLIRDHQKLSEERREQFECAIYFTVILEVFTVLMSNDQTFVKTLMECFFESRGVNKEEAGGIVENFRVVYKNTGEFFAALKMISIEPSMWQLRCWREAGGNPDEKKVKQFVKDHKLSVLTADYMIKTLDIEADRQRTGLRINIIEAVKSQPLENRGELNAQAGYVLISALEVGVRDEKYRAEYVSKSLVPPHWDDVVEKDESFWKTLYTYETGGNSVEIIADLSQEWVNLYESWNMAFVANKFPTMLHLILPKLFIPSTLAAAPATYLVTRIFSLWLTLNFNNFMMASKEEVKNKVEYPISDSMNDLLGIWAYNNRAYALKYLWTFKQEMLSADYTTYAKKPWLITLMTRIRME
jgi:hypothetical protein